MIYSVNTISIATNQANQLASLNFVANPNWTKPVFAEPGSAQLQLWFKHKNDIFNCSEGGKRGKMNQCHIVTKSKQNVTAFLLDESLNQLDWSNPSFMNIYLLYSHFMIHMRGSLKIELCLFCKSFMYSKWKLFASIYLFFNNEIMNI